MPTHESILSKGYFPQELPRAFTTVSYGSFIEQNLSNLPGGFASSGLHSKNAVHNLAIRGKLRRKLGIPNPVNFYQLASFVCQHWTELLSCASRSSISLTRPVDPAPIRAIVDIKKGFRDRAASRAHIRSTSRYILQADISRFYHSIYTHSIPWAIHDKSVAKTDQNDALFGNILDRLVRNAQDRQTLGIPIGPDTSLLIAEIILSAIDVDLANQRITTGFRIMDDYEFGFKTRAEAEVALGILQESLNKYELALNPNKTQILELPLPTEDIGIPELRALQLSDAEKSGHKTQLYDIIYHFDRAFELFRENPEGTFLKYMLPKFNKVVIHSKNWSYFENMLLQSAITEPGTLSGVSGVVEQLLRHKALGHTLTIDHIGDGFNEIIKQHGPLGHGNEVAWAIWGLLVLQIPLEEKSATIAASMNDSIVAILTLDADKKGLVPSGVDYSDYELFMTTENLYGEQWLLAYEANVKGWPPSVGTADHVKDDQCFNCLKTNGVYFYDDTLSPRIEPQLPPEPSEEEEY